MSSDTYATNDTVLHNSGDETSTGTKTFQEIKISNKKFPSLVQTDGQYVTLDGGNTEIVPADNSKVVHSTVTQLNSTDMNTIFTAGFYQLNSGTNGMPNADAWTIYQVIPLDSLNGVQIAYQTNNAILGMRSWNSGPGHITFTSWVQFADDSKVAHLSGANNFDTVPTVDNNPLLLASSLPSDLARTGSNQEFTGKNTFDTAPIDKTTGNPYITKDGVPSLPPDLARTGQANTFNLTQTFSQGAKTLQTGSYSDTNSLVNEGLYYNTNSSIQNGAPSITTGYIQVMSGGGEIVKQIMHSDTDAGLIYDRTSQNGGSSWSNWTQIVTWDQIPSNIVETNQPQTFTAQQTFSIAPIDSTTGNPYITKDGVPSLPSDLARTGQSQTFTANQTFSIAPTITDASRDKGDNQAATMADLKSVEKSAWHPVSVSMTNFTIENAFYKKDNTKMTYELFVIGSTETNNENIDQKGILFQDPEVHNFGELTNYTLYGIFGLKYYSGMDAYCGEIGTKCSTATNKIYYENSYYGYSIESSTKQLPFSGYIHIVGTFN